MKRRLIPLWDAHDRRLLLFRGVLGATLLAQIALCPRLWVGERAFPTVPTLGNLPDLPPALDFALVALLIGGIVATAFLTRPRRSALVVVTVGATLALFDLNRLQPWFYQALLLFLAVSLPGPDRGFITPIQPSPQGEEPTVEAGPAWAVAAFVLAITYVWSGLQKASPAFVGQVFPVLLHPLGLDAFRPLGFAAPVLETAIGFLLLVPRTRVWGLAGSVATHAFLLLVLGPFGGKVNSVVWPWNVGMPLLCFALFFRESRPVLRAAWSPPLGKAVVVLAGVLPALNFVGLWDDDLADALYSGRSRQAFILLNERGAASLPSKFQPYLQRRSDRIGLDLNRWALAALNVPPYPEPRFYRAVAQRLQEGGVASEDMALVVSDRPGFSGEKLEFRVVPIH